MSARLKGKVAVITGSGQGIGRAYAIAFAKEGAKVVINDLGTALDGAGASTSVADEVVAEIKKLGGEAVANYDTVATMEGAKNIIGTAVNSFGKIDILVNNAGIVRDRMIWNMTEEEWDAVVAVHGKGLFACTHFASKLMREQKSGRIINTSSIAIQGNPTQPNYVFCKSGVIGFTKSCANSLGRYGITVNAFMPAASTRMSSLVTEEIIKKREAEGQALPGITWPLPDPADIGPVVAYLATDDAANINGQIIGIIGSRVFLYNHPDEIKTIYKDGRWTVDELVKFVPQTLAAGIVNPAPRKDKK